MRQLRGYAIGNPGDGAAEDSANAAVAEYLRSHSWTDLRNDSFRLRDSPLHEAALHGWLSTIQLILDYLKEHGGLHDAFFLQSKDNGRTALHAAIYTFTHSKQEDSISAVCELLLSYTTPDVADSLSKVQTLDGKLAWEVALDQSFVRLAHLLLTAGEPSADVTWPTPSQVQALSADEHIKTGISAKGIVAVLKAFGFLRDGEICNDAVHRRGALGLDWLDAICPGKVCAHDLQYAIENDVITKGFGRVSMVEIMSAINHPSIGPANDFFCHAQIEPLEQTLMALKMRELQAAGARYFLLDLSNLRQGIADDNLVEMFGDAIATLGHTSLMLTSLVDPVELKDIFCLFDIAFTLHRGAGLDTICAPGSAAEFVRALDQDFDSTLRPLTSVDILGAQGQQRGQAQVRSKEEIVQRITRYVDIEEANRYISQAIIAGVARHLARTPKETFASGTLHAAMRFFAETLPQLPRAESLSILRRCAGEYKQTLLHHAASLHDSALLLKLLLAAGTEGKSLLAMRDQAFGSCTPKQRALGRQMTDDKAAVLEVLTQAEEAEDVLVFFRLRHAETCLGESLRLVGSCTGLGTWDPAQGPQMRTGAGTYPEWISMSSFPNTGGPMTITYKYVRDRSGLGQGFDWEETPNRTLELPIVAAAASSPSAWVVYDDAFGVATSTRVEQLLS